MNLGNIIVQGGLLQRAGQDYEEEQSRRALAQRVRQYGIKELDASEPLLAAHADEVRAGLEDKSRVRGNAAAYRQLASGGASFDELASEAQRRGDFKTAQEFLTTRRTMETEGFKSVVTSALSGADGAEIERIFNSTGRERVDPGSVQINQDTGIITYNRGGQPGKLNAGKLGVLLGLVKPREPKQIAVAPGGAVAIDGKITDVNTAGVEAKSAADLKKIEAQGALKSKLAAFRVRNGVQKATALERNMQMLVDTGVAADHAEAYQKLRTGMGKSPEDQTLSLASTLMRGSAYRGRDGSRRAFEDAARMVGEMRGTRGGDADADADAGAPAARPGGSAPNTRKYSVQGKTFTDADINATAKKYGITPDQVKQRLGIR